MKLGSDINPKDFLQSEKHLHLPPVSLGQVHEYYELVFIDMNFV